MLVKVEIVSVGIDQSQQIPLLILKEANGNRTLPIALGTMEAQVIALHAMNVTPDRPLTVDCAHLIMETLGGTLFRVVIADLINHVFYAQLHIARNGSTFIIDCRPSDAIALSLRCGAPIFVHEQVFDKCGSGKTALEKEKLKNTITSLNTLDFGKYYLV